MRFVVYGSLGPYAALLRQRPVLATLTSLITDGGTRPESSSLAGAVDAGLLARTPDGLRLGHRVLPAPRVPRPALTAVGATAAAVVRGRIGAARRAVTDDAMVTPGPWESVALLVIGGVLLDVLVGEHLRITGTVGPVRDGGRLWALENAPAVTVGMRCDHDPTLGIGAGVLWTDESDLRIRLPQLADLPAVVDATGADGSRQAESLLRLRRCGWLNGARREFLFLDRGGALSDVLDATAADLVTTVYRPFILDHAEVRDPHSVLMTSRMIMEHCLADLVGDHTLPIAPDVSSRLVWRGRNWLLFEESSRELDHVGC